MRCTPRRTSRSAVRQTAAVLLGSALVPLVAAAAPAGNTHSYTDSVGDNRNASGTAPDIAAVAVESKDSGAVRFDVTLVDAASLGAHQEVAAALDLDRNEKTGEKSNGADVVVTAYGTSQPPSLSICRYSSESNSCKYNLPGAEDTPVDARSHVVTLPFKVGVGAFKFDLAGRTEPGQSLTRGTSRRIPDGGHSRSGPTATGTV